MIRILAVLSFLIITFLEGNARLTPPNIIFILVDDMGYYDLSSYGANEVQTNRIDKLAAEGIRFTDFYAAAPICSPSRAGLLTGCYPRRVGNHIWVHRPDSDNGLNSGELTMAELFKQNGYRTACVGKWHLGFEESFLPHNQGFDHYFGILHNLDPHETVHYQAAGGIPVIRDGVVVERPADPADLPRLYTDEAIRLITSWVEDTSTGDHKSESNEEPDPFFLYLPHTTLHHPLGVSESFRGSSQWGEYGDAIHELDYHTGRLIDKLKALKIEDNTVVVFMSDNGRGPGRTPVQPIRGSKLTTYEGGLRVPCIIWGPGFGIQKGETSEVMAHAMDWYPTLMSIAGISIPGNIILDGRDLSGLITGNSNHSYDLINNGALNATIPLRRYWNPGKEWGDQITREEYLNAFFYHGSTGELAAVRSGKWKLHLNPDLKLYDLENDPGEQNPVNDSKMKWKLRGMAALFQEEMLHTSRPVGKKMEQEE